MSSPIEIPSDAIALFRLPVPLQKITQICVLYRDCDVKQQEEWLVVLKREKKEGSTE